MTPLKVLALAAASGRVGYVYLIGGQLKDWRTSDKAAKSPKLAARLTISWVERLQPDVVVTEKVEDARKKGAKTKGIVTAMAHVAAETSDVLDVSVTRPHDFANKYEEAEDLAGHYPEILAWLPPKRRFYDNEPRNTVLFEALSLADAVLREGPAGLARAMG